MANVTRGMVKDKKGIWRPVQATPQAAAPVDRVTEMVGLTPAGYEAFLKEHIDAGTDVGTYAVALLTLKKNSGLKAAINRQLAQKGVCGRKRTAPTLKIDQHNY
ncbi:MAG: hypothetical protein HQK89_02225 [Nitrospirae bacterium]|nr:hypothetical protein [Nitrospirota bacterium]